MVQSGGVVEYTDCNSAEGVFYSPGRLGYRPLVDGVCRDGKG